MNLKPCPFCGFHVESIKMLVPMVDHHKDCPLYGIAVPSKNWNQRQSEWISVDERLPDENEKVWFWLIPKPAEECPSDSSGSPITAEGEKPYKYICRWKCWGSLYKPTHWMPLPDPPKETP